MRECRRSNVLWLVAVAVVALLACDDGSDGPEEDSGIKPEKELEFESIELQGKPKGLTAIHFLPDRTNEFLVLTKSGSVLHYELEGDDNDDTHLRGEVRIPNVHNSSDCGLISIAFDPDFDTNRYVYLGQCFSETESGIVRVAFDPDDYDGTAKTAVEIIRLGDPRSMRSWHNVGRIGFDEDGVLWALFGDKTIPENSQDPASPLGALLRIRPRMGEDGGYEPVGGGPIDLGDPAHPAVYARGFRSPWTGLLDSQGRYWVGDVGSTMVEEVNVVTEPGKNYGWGLSEGPCDEDGCRDTTDPVLSWDRSDDHRFVREDREAGTTLRRVVWVGLEYQDRGNDRYEGKLTNKVLYGDLCVGFVRAAQMSATGEITDEAIGHLPYASGWDQGPDGFIYAVSFGRCQTEMETLSGNLYRLEYDD